MFMESGVHSGVTGSSQVDSTINRQGFVFLATMVNLMKSGRIETCPMCSADKHPDQWICQDCMSEHGYMAVYTLQVLIGFEPVEKKQLRPVKVSYDKGLAELAERLMRRNDKATKDEIMVLLIEQVKDQGFDQAVIEVSVAQAAIRRERWKMAMKFVREHVAERPLGDYWIVANRLVAEHGIKYGYPSILVAVLYAIFPKETMGVVPAPRRQVKNPGSAARKSKGPRAKTVEVKADKKAKGKNKKGK